MIEFTRKHMDLAYDSKIVALYKDYLETPDGRSVIYDYVRHKCGGGAGALLVDDSEYTYLVRLYRNTVNAATLEIPAGGYAYPGETGEACARREAEEETGFIPQKLYHVTNMVSAIGTFDERTDVYIGMMLKTGTVKYDPDEYIEVVHLPIEEAIHMVYDGKIIDGKTVVALFAYEHMKHSGII